MLSQFELQRKFLFPRETEFKNEILIKNKNLDCFENFNHSEYIYMDIYVDTQDSLLLKNNLSLRIRKKIYDSQKSNYSIQLKSEMNNYNDERMEVEESELYIYRVKNKGKWKNITDVLDSTFDIFMNDTNFFENKEFTDFIVTITKWINFKYKSSITPFQKLRGYEFIEKKKSSFRPLVIGFIKRSRSHIYLSNDSCKRKFNLNDFKNKKDKDFSFRKNKNYLWLFESSWDEAVFHPLNSSYKKLINITEYELENKFSNNIEIANKLMDKYEASIKYYKIKKNIYSKYKQAINLFTLEKDG